ncbi:MAG: c-type cytochrome [Verrucomicrobia bacterium]|nr:c-type cytochrome [Verrucomicrobiota bacterium]
MSWSKRLTSAAALCLAAACPLPAADRNALAPVALVATADGSTLFVANTAAATVQELAARGELKRKFLVDPAPTGLALSPDGRTLAVTCAAPQSTVALVDLASGKITARLRAGHTATAPVFSADGRTLWICNRFNDEVALLDLATGATLTRLPVVRQPLAAALTPDDRRLFVANHLPADAADAPIVSAMISVIDTAARTVSHTLRLPNGSGLVLGVAIPPDGRHVAITHNLARYQLPTTQVERGWINSAALTLLDAAEPRLLATVLLDELDAGAANPWAVAFASTGAQLVVTHAGTHELSVIDFPELLARLARAPATAATDLAFLLGARRRVPLQGKGPRALAIARPEPAERAADRAWVTHYFSDALESVDLANPKKTPQLIPLGPPPRPSRERLGELYFNDATYCFQHWQSCFSCHSWDARADGFNWDNLNDGIGNPKNAKSLLHAHRTPPAMSIGVRESAEIAVRAGFRHIQFANPPEDVPSAVDAWLKSLTPEPSPLLENGRLSAAAQRGKRIFEDRKVACASCHSGRYFTDLHSYAVGTSNRTDPPEQPFDTPTLIEIWRTAPYLHDGSARTMREVLIDRNAADRHGRTSHLTPAQLDDLVAYLLSL